MGWSDHEGGGINEEDTVPYGGGIDLRHDDGYVLRNLVHHPCIRRGGVFRCVYMIKYNGEIDRCLLVLKNIC